MTRSVSIVFVLAVLAAPVFALDLGDPAPTLSIKEWVKGEAVDLAAARGSKVVVVEFWATWSGSCMEGIPLLTEIQKRFADQGVVVIGVTSEGPKNSLETVRKFVTDSGDGMGYTVAFDDGDKTQRAWMAAAGRTGIPCAFVVDKAGMIAWIGDPWRGLRKVLADVLAGRNDIVKAKAMLALQTEIDGAGRSRNWAGLLAAAEKMVPVDAANGNLYKFWALSEQGKLAEAFAAATAGFEAAKDASEFLSVASSIRETDSKEHDFAGLALRAIDRAIELEPANAQAWEIRFRLLAAKGEAENAKAAAAKTIELRNDDAIELNDFAWALLTEDGLKGNWNEIALTASTRANELTANERWEILGTLALAKFETGATADAVTLEEKSIELAKKEGVTGKDLADLEEALKRFRPAQAAVAVDFGPFRFVPPDGWEKDPESGAWRPKEGQDKDIGFVWAGPAKLGTQSLEKFLETCSASLETSLKAKATRTEGPQSMPFPSGVQAVLFERELTTEAGVAIYTSQAAFAFDGEVCFLVFMCPNAETYRALVETAIGPMIRSVTAREAGCEVGSLCFQPPEGWLRSSESGKWTSNGYGLSNCAWWGPRPATSDPLEKQIEGFRSSVDPALKVLESYSIRPLEIPSGVPAVGGERVVQKASLALPSYIYDAVFQIGDQVYFFRFESYEERAQYVAMKESVITPLVMSVRQATPVAAGEMGDLAPMAVASETREVARFCFSLTVPAAWKDAEDEKEQAHLFRLLATLRVGEKAYITFPVVCEVRPGVSEDARGTLARWMTERLRGMALDAKPSYNCRRTDQYQVGKLGSGQIAGMTIREYREKRAWNARTDAWLVERDGCTLLIGIAFGATDAYSALSEAERDLAAKEYNALRDETLAVATNCRFDLPPAQETWAQFLMRKGSYRYHYESSSAHTLEFGGGTRNVYSGSTRKREWTFHPDQTCEMVEDDYFGVTGSSEFMTPTTGLLAGSDASSGGSGRSRFEVRGKGDGELWIVLYRPGGWTTFHRFEPEAEGVFGDEKPKGMAIDGRIEGDYEVVNGIYLWRAPK
ncbi:MAG: TlpA family protein disulfide reductase [Planctomycetes bacterium]|nr:TlpA family protein disulfide reductase [Planctomycetota bacterium]